MTPAIDAMLNETLRVEGGYSNNKNDPGGETNFGVTIAVARRNGYLGAMKNMTRLEAFNILKSEFVIRPGFDQLALISTSVAREVIDTGINMGPSVACLFLQQALNVLNEQGHDYSDIREDGNCGLGTRQALAAYRLKRGAEGEIILIRALNVYQGAKYLGITASRPADEDFIYGWLRNRVTV